MYAINIIVKGMFICKCHPMSYFGLPPGVTDVLDIVQLCCQVMYSTKKNSRYPNVLSAVIQIVMLPAITV